ncbi:MAG: chemotaxis protein CheW [Symbiobacteriaceae bacterium]|nr:chemotaxis protein CheW [Symbiobacteriaceae bacterium]
MSEQFKYLTFMLGEETYGLPILQVKGINQMQPITHVPRMSHFVKGVINLRGKIITIIDLRLKFGLEEIEHNERTCIINVELEEGGRQSGLIVDEVSEVLDVPADSIEPPPSDAGGSLEFLTGIGKAKGKVIMLLDPYKILSTGEMAML